MSKNVMLEKVMALDFLAYDLALFLDTHPYDKKAIDKYCAIVEEGKQARREYEQNYEPLSHHDAAKSGKWDWICEPWPWECEANFDMNGGE